MELYVTIVIFEQVASAMETSMLVKKDECVTERELMRMSLVITVGIILLFHHCNLLIQIFAHFQRRNSFNQGRRRLNGRSFRAEREYSIRRTVYVSDIDQQVWSFLTFYNICYFPHLNTKQLDLTKAPFNLGH